MSLIRFSTTKIKCKCHIKRTQEVEVDTLSLIFSSEVIFYNFFQLANSNHDILLEDVKWMSI